MGRKLKRVSLSFKWPLNQVWVGYINPYKSVQCKICEGSGLSPEMKELHDSWYTHLRTDGKEGWGHHLDEQDVAALLKASRLWDFTRIPINDEQRELVKKRVASGKHNSWLPFDNGVIPTPEQVNEWSRKGIGHDGLNHWVCVKARAKRLGIKQNCPYCKGKGHFWFSKEIEKKAERFKGRNPPKGRGYQLWETTSEGSPISPVFKTMDELCGWAADNASTFGRYKTTKEEWRKMLDKDFVHHSEGNAVFI